MNAPAVRRWYVEPYGFGREIFEAPTRDAAKYRAFRALRETGRFNGRDGFWRFIVAGVRISEIRP